MTDDNAVLRIQDELEIRNLIARLAHLVDDGELEEYVAQFTKDATWGGGRHPIRQGHDEIREGARLRRESGHMGPGTGTRHVVSTSWIEIDGDRAIGRSVYHYYREAGRVTPTLYSLGVYADVYRKTTAGWRLAERVLKSCAPEQAG